MTPEPYVDEINEQLEVEPVDNGIGPYEFHGAPGYDSQPGLDLVINVAEIDVSDADDVPLSITGTYSAESGELPWIARLNSVVRPTKRQVLARYEVEVNDAA